MHDMLQAKVDRLAGKTYFAKNTLKTAFFSGKNGQDLEAKLDAIDIDKKRFITPF